MDYLIDDYDNLTVLPIEVKSGKDYTIHSALDKFLDTPDYHIKRAVLFSNEREIRKKGGIIYQPIYYCMFYSREKSLNDTDYIIPEITL